MYDKREANKGYLKSTETGVIECETCLPCSHLVGSACIAIWLRSNNTCPVYCRVFFPAHPSQPDYHLMDAIPYEDERFFMTICERLCQELELSQPASETAQDMADLLGRRRLAPRPYSSMDSSNSRLQGIAHHG